MVTLDGEEYVSDAVSVKVVWEPENKLNGLGRWRDPFRTFFFPVVKFKLSVYLITCTDHFDNFVLNNNKIEPQYMFNEYTYHDECEVC